MIGKCISECNGDGVSEIFGDFRRFSWDIQVCEPKESSTVYWRIFDTFCIFCIIFEAEREIINDKWPFHFSLFTFHCFNSRKFSLDGVVFQHFWKPQHSERLFLWQFLTKRPQNEALKPWQRSNSSSRWSLRTYFDAVLAIWRDFFRFTRFSDEFLLDGKNVRTSLFLQLFFFFSINFTQIFRICPKMLQFLTYLLHKQIIEMRRSQNLHCPFSVPSRRLQLLQVFSYFYDLTALTILRTIFKDGC